MIRFAVKRIRWILLMLLVLGWTTLWIVEIGTRQVVDGKSIVQGELAHEFRVNLYDSRKHTVILLYSKDIGQGYTTLDYKVRRWIWEILLKLLILFQSTSSEWIVQWLPASFLQIDHSYPASMTLMPLSSRTRKSRDESADCLTREVGSRTTFYSWRNPPRIMV